MPDEPQVVHSDVDTPSTAPPTEGRALRRRADQPHHLSLILSVAAIVVSLISWRESHASRIASQSASRAVLEVADVSMSAKPSQDGKRDFELSVKNQGRATAQAIGYWWGVEVNNTTPLEEFRHSPHYFNPPNPKLIELKEFNSEIAPGSQHRLPFSVELGVETPNPPGPPGPEAIIYVYGAIQYKDEATHNNFTSRWCFSIRSGRSRPCELASMPDRPSVN